MAGLTQEGGVLRTLTFIEAVTANSPDDINADISGAPAQPPDDFWAYIENEMPQRFGSPLYSKLKKKYWEAEHVRGNPFVLAIADFHSSMSMTWSHTALSLYLYGVGADILYDKHGKKYGVEKKIDQHIVGDKEIPSNFFEQSDTEHISAILFSNAGTYAKFNRMGVRAGFGDPNVKLVRRGGLFDPAPDAFDAIPFQIDVESPEYHENWADEFDIYHNPNALNPLSDDMFPDAANFRLEGDEVIWRGASPRGVLYSVTQSINYGSRTDESPKT